LTGVSVLLGLRVPTGTLGVPPKVLDLLGTAKVVQRATDLLTGNIAEAIGDMTA